MGDPMLLVCEVVVGKLAAYIGKLTNFKSQFETPSELAGPAPLAPFLRPTRFQQNRQIWFEFDHWSNKNMVN